MVADVLLTPAGAHVVSVHLAPPREPAKKQVHARRALPPTPQAAPRPEGERWTRI